MRYSFICTPDGFDCIVSHNGKQVIIPYEQVPEKVKARFEQFRPFLKAIFQDGGRFVGKQGSIFDRLEKAKGEGGDRRVAS